MTIPSAAPLEPAARRLDRAVDTLLAEGRAIVDPSLRPLLEAAAAIRAALPLLPSSLLFEERLGRRLTGAGAASHPLAVRARAVLPHQHRLLMAGAVGSAAVGVAGATAYAVWRANRRQP